MLLLLLLAENRGLVVVDSCERRLCTRMRWLPEGVKSELLKEISSSESSESDRREMSLILFAEDAGVFWVAIDVGRRGVVG